MAPDMPISLWQETAQENEIAPEEIRDGVVDLAVVGGGYTGLSTALHAAEAGLEVQVIEAEEVGHGGSGRNVGLVNAAAWLPPAKVRAILGDTYGPRFVERFSAAPDYVFSLIERHQIRCSPTRNGTIHAAHAPRGLRDLEGRHAEWQRLGAPVDLLDRDEVARLTGSRTFHGGLLDHRAGTVQPMGYARGLARAARGAGARIATGLRATGLHREAGLWHVTTEGGTVRARHVVLGTNAYTDELWPGLSQCLTRIPFLQVATEPLGARAADILPAGQGLWDTGTIMFSLRRDAEGRMIIGSMGEVVGSSRAGLSRRWAKRKLARLFPDLGEVAFETAWHGQIAMTPDHLPRILRLDEGLYAPIGYNGRGITTGTVFGQAMAELLTGADEESLPLPVTEPERDRLAPVMTPLYRAAFVANQVWKSI
ncbi:FAD-binding oxidoreductase [Roseovarius sp. SCSIO 43702]|uniref:NAD(P)/FAD-dependent oxidoreductase n=1 Tax=Roseovarius sp. SCSIO 43702 TaxID=2823043 RepID=UPI001C73358E|nr:FAD-binding oxidoreductase [Roseovarius sp. SCSIO 43702]QYX55712.1 FAD-binding oxidoreductase [Roseovarius sp. SCSIO 43702]